MKRKFNENLKEHYESFELNPRQLKGLELMEQEHSGRKQDSGSYKLLWPVTALVAGLFIVVFSLPNQNKISPERIADEIAYQHNKTLSLEFEGNSIPEIKQHFSKLDFNLVNSNHSRISDLELIGGRYSSINKNLAAQLRLIQRNSPNQITWYQLPIDTNGIEIKSEQVIYRNGVKIIMWTEKGVLHGLAIKQ